jgi:hypothetical protein
MGQAPDEPNVLHGEIKKCVHMMGEPRDKLTVEIDETDEGLHLLLVRCSRPVCYTSNLDRIHFDIIVQDDNLQILNLSFLNSHFLGRR